MARIKDIKSRVPRKRTKAFAVNVKVRNAPMVSMLAQREGSAEKGRPRTRSAMAKIAALPAIIAKAARAFCAGARCIPHRPTAGKLQLLSLSRAAKCQMRRLFVNYSVYFRGEPSGDARRARSARLCIPLGGSGTGCAVFWLVGRAHKT